MGNAPILSERAVMKSVGWERCAERRICRVRPVLDWNGIATGTADVGSTQPDWMPLVAALIGGLLAGLLGYIAASKGRSSAAEQAQKDREESRRAAWRTRAAEAYAQALLASDQLRAIEIAEGLSHSPEDPGLRDMFQDVWERQRAARIELAVVALIAGDGEDASESATRVRDALQKRAKAFYDVYVDVADTQARSDFDETDGPVTEALEDLRRAVMTLPE